MRPDAPSGYASKPVAFPRTAPCQDTHQIASPFREKDTHHTHYASNRVATPEETHKNRPLPKKWLHLQRCRRIRLPLTREAKTACTATRRSPLLKVAVMFPGDGWEPRSSPQQRGDAGRYDRRGAAAPQEGVTTLNLASKASYLASLGPCHLKTAYGGGLRQRCPRQRKEKPRVPSTCGGLWGAREERSVGGKGRIELGTNPKYQNETPALRAGASNSCHSTPRGWRPGQQQVQHAGTSEQNRRQ
jgi:hypothetical protein